MNFSALVLVPLRLLVPKVMMMRCGCRILTASGMVTALLMPENSSHFSVVIAPTPMLTTPMLLRMVV